MSITNKEVLKPYYISVDDGNNRFLFRLFSGIIFNKYIISIYFSTSTILFPCINSYILLVTEEKYLLRACYT